MDIPPVNTLMNCGSSSSEVRRRKLPTRVTRGSFCVAWVTTLSFSITFMERNFHTMIGLPSMP
ncbi:Uncharacterised protein [Enterobacter cloacae]|nr:Uncharacterised protein [Enterobacter cloacae]